MPNETCDVVGCNKPAYRSVSVSELSKVGLNLKISARRGRVHLCKDHYKEFKKARKNIKKYEKWRIGSVY